MNFMRLALASVVLLAMNAGISSAEEPPVYGDISGLKVAKPADKEDYPSTPAPPEAMGRTPGSLSTVERCR